LRRARGGGGLAGGRSEPRDRPRRRRTGGRGPGQQGEPVRLRAASPRGRAGPGAARSMTICAGRRTGRGTARAMLAAALLLATLVTGSLDAAPPPPDGWRIRFDVRMDGLVDQGRFVIGAGSGAVDGRDAFDDAHPPALPHHLLDLVAEHRQDEAGWDTQERPVLRYRAQYDSPLGSRARTVPFVLETDRTG